MKLCLIGAVVLLYESGAMAESSEAVHLLEQFHVMSGGARGTYVG